MELLFSPNSNLCFLACMFAGDEACLVLKHHSAFFVRSTHSLSLSKALRSLYEIDIIQKGSLPFRGSTLQSFLLQFLIFRNLIFVNYGDCWGNTHLG